MALEALKELLDKLLGNNCECNNEVPRVRDISKDKDESVEEARCYVKLT